MHFVITSFIYSKVVILFAKVYSVCPIRMTELTGKLTKNNKAVIFSFLLQYLKLVCACVYSDRDAEEILH